jgi:hypothetical protein
MLFLQWTAVVSLNSINRLGFRRGVFCEVRTEYFGAFVAPSQEDESKNQKNKWRQKKGETIKINQIERQRMCTFRVTNVSDVMKVDNKMTEWGNNIIHAFWLAKKKRGKLFVWDPVLIPDDNLYWQLPLDCRQLPLFLATPVRFTMSVRLQACKNWISEHMFHLFHNLMLF